jgi:hypothetical protein
VGQVGHTNGLRCYTQSACFVSFIVGQAPHVLQQGPIAGHNADEISDDVGGGVEALGGDGGFEGDAYAAILAQFPDLQDAVEGLSDDCDYETFEAIVQAMLGNAAQPDDTDANAELLGVDVDAQDGQQPDATNTAQEEEWRGKVKDYKAVLKEPLWVVKDKSGSVVQSKST